MSTPTPPAFTITKGNPTEPEVAALATVLSSLAHRARLEQSSPQFTRDNWNNLTERLTRGSNHNMSNLGVFR